MQKLLINTSLQCAEEKKYIIDVIFDYLGIPYDLSFNNQYQTKYYEITYEGRILTISDTFFSQFTNKKWLAQDTLPYRPLKYLTLEQSSHLPIIYGSEELRKTEDRHFIGVDIFGSSFFMLSRYEEAIADCVFDKYGRFPAKESIAYKENFLQRPIVNEYIELLWSSLKQLWPNLERKKHNFEIRYTCDVDHIVDRSIKNPLFFIKRISSDILKYGSLSRFRNSFVDLITQKNRYNSFDFIFDKLKEFKVEGVFFFITKNTCDLDSSYSFNDPKVESIILKILNEGYEIGLHPSFNTYTNLEQLEEEFELIKGFFKNQRILHKSWSSRQHFLRWKTPETAIYLNHQGIKYDYSLGYADEVGFRCGTCFDFPIYDLIGRRKLEIIERPLILMESTLIDERYMNKGYSKESYEIIRNLKEKCKMFNGSFTFLWHNSHFDSDEDRELFSYVIQ